MSLLPYYDPDPNPITKEERLEWARVRLEQAVELLNQETQPSKLRIAAVKGRFLEVQQIRSWIAATADLPRGPKRR